MEDVTILSKLCDVLGLNLKEKLLDEVDGSIGNIDSWIEDGLSEEASKRLTCAVQRLSDIKFKRFIQLKKMASAMISYWSILSTPLGEKRDFLSLQHYAEVNSEVEITEDNALSLDSIKTVQNEFGRLQQQMVDLISKKKSKLDEILQSSHLKSTFANIGTSDCCQAFEEIKSQISVAKGQASQRKDIVTRVELLQSSKEEISWYLASCASTKDQRVTRAKVLVNVFPKMMRDLKEKIDTWKLEEKRGTFLFDGVDVSQMVNNLERDYNDLLGIDQSGEETEPVQMEIGAVDIFQLTVPRRARDPRVPVLQPPPPPPLQGPSDDDSVPSDETKSDPCDTEYLPDPNDFEYPPSD